MTESIFDNKIISVSMNRKKETILFLRLVKFLIIY